MNAGFNLISLVPTMDMINFGGLAKNALEEALRERGHANVLIAGRTGVGKSTLINSVFQGNLATTGQGRPVTQDTREITKEGIPLSIFDTRGLELADFSSTKSLKAFLVERHRDRDEKKQIHVAWICIVEDLRRVEQAETDLASMLAEFMPVIAVITKARADQGFRAEVQRLLPAAKNVVRTRSIAAQFDDGHTLAPMGLVELVQLTMELFPEGQKRAFVAAQKADLALKRQRSHLIVATTASSAAGVGAMPVPFADAAMLVPVQIAMVAGITATYGLAFSDGFLSTLVASMVGGTAATLTGRAIVGGLLKLIPGVGSVVGGAISATTAAAVTSAFGEAYIAALDALFAKHLGEPPTQQEVLEELRKRLGGKSTAAQ
ncbi:YcjF family protein [Anatilimnocola floriformis]|uniref:YcjF family protein n=1 Tax=Anatilimnocola floriformis TaxID=2948575 RepID=UPI0020C41CF0|nr:GTPase [Anatilimnocola floriformis]